MTTHPMEAEELPIHVAACAERYEHLNRRLQRIERILWWWGTLIVGGMVGIIVKLTVLTGGL